MTKEQLVRTRSSAGALTISLDSPSNRNALSARLLGDLRHALDEAAADEAVRVVSLTGEGQVFCAGADLSNPPGNDPGESFGLLAVLQAIADVPKPVVARVNGHARAGGLGLIAACDVAIAPDHVNFAFSEVRVGVAPAIGSVFCQPLMAPRQFARYTLSGTVFSATEALSAGLLTDVVPAAALDAAIDRVVGEFLLGAPSAVARTKDLSRRLTALTGGDGLQLAAQISASQFQAPDAVEGIAAFREKRTPRWAS